MIRNLIFDFGQVLVRFDPEIILSPYISAPADPYDENFSSSFKFVVHYFKHLYTPSLRNLG